MKVALNFKETMPQQQFIPYRHYCGAVHHYTVTTPSDYMGPSVCFCGEVITDSELATYFTKKVKQ